VGNGVDAERESTRAAHAGGGAPEGASASKSGLVDPSKGVHNTDTLFAEFVAAYPRKGAPGATATAFRAAMARGRNPAMLVAEAKRYANERAAIVARDAVQANYTYGPMRWLDEEKWREEVSPHRAAKVIDQDGNPVLHGEANRPLDGWDIAAANVARAMWGDAHVQQH
jgi:hypothetical protein